MALLLNGVCMVKSTIMAQMIASLYFVLCLFASCNTFQYLSEDTKHRISDSCKNVKLVLRLKNKKHNKGLVKMSHLNMDRISLNSIGNGFCV